MGLSSRHFAGIGDDFQSGTERRRPKGSADIFTGFILFSYPTFICRPLVRVSGKGWNLW